MSSSASNPAGSPPPRGVEEYPLAELPLFYRENLVVGREVDRLRVSRDARALAFVRSDGARSRALHLAHLDGTALLDGETELPSVQEVRIFEVNRRSAKVWIRSRRFRGVAHVDPGGVLLAERLFHRFGVVETEHGNWLRGRFRSDPPYRERYASVHTSFAVDIRSDVVFSSPGAAVVVEPRSRRRWVQHVVRVGVEPELPPDDVVVGAPVLNLPFVADRVQVFALRPLLVYLVERKRKASLTWASPSGDGEWTREDREAWPPERIWRGPRGALVLQGFDYGDHPLGLVRKLAFSAAVLAEGYFAPPTRVAFSPNGEKVVVLVDRYESAIGEGRSEVPSHPEILTANEEGGISVLRFDATERIEDLAIDDEGNVAFVHMKDGRYVLVSPGMVSRDYDSAWNLRPGAGQDAGWFVANAVRDGIAIFVRVASGAGVPAELGA